MIKSGSMKNICFLNTTSFWGGGEKIHFDYASKFKERGYTVFIAADKRNELYSRANKADIDTFALRLKNLSFLNPIKYIRLYRFFKKSKIDTVIISTSHDTKVGVLTAKLAGLKRIVLYRALAAPVKASKINQYLYNNVITHLIANSLETKRTMSMNFGNRLKRNIQIIYQGLDFEEMSNRKINKHSFDSEKIIIGNAGRLTIQKGQHHFIEIAKILKKKSVNFKIVIAGTGELEEQLLKEIKINELQNEIELLGFVEDMSSFMESIDIFALTSEWEGFGYVIAEAMFARKPVVAFNITSNPELVKTGFNGYLVPYEDLELFSEKLADLTKNKEIRETLGTQGCKFVQENFSLDNIIDQFEEQLAS